jgi:hypothetical protein
MFAVIKCQMQLLKKTTGFILYYYSGFCEQVACTDHLRKRRRKKNKW